MTDPSHDVPAALLAPATVVVAAGRPAPTSGAPMNPPVQLTSTYRTAPSYGRFENETWTALEEALAALEGSGLDQAAQATGPVHALSYAAGMAAISAVVDLVPVGGLVLAPQAPYSGTAALLSRLHASGRLVHREVPVADTDAVLAALPGAALLMLESPTNPLLEVADLRALTAAARAAGVLVAVDNTFATPLLQRPLELGADVVVHSATKYLGGHSDVLLGATLTRDAALAERLRGYRTLSGSVPGPFEAWLVLRGLRTLALRVERAGANAAELARRLDAHPAVARVRHPSLPQDPGHERARAQMSGFGAIIAIELPGDDVTAAAAADRVCASVRLWGHATSLGGVESTLERRRRFAAESTLVPPGLIRLSVGIEDVEDLWRDLDAALQAG